MKNVSAFDWFYFYLLYLAFVRQSIIEGVRLDGRKISDYRDVSK